LVFSSGPTCSPCWFFSPTCIPKIADPTPIFFGSLGLPRLPCGSVCDLFFSNPHCVCCLISFFLLTLLDNIHFGPRKDHFWCWTSVPFSLTPIPLPWDPKPRTKACEIPHLVPHPLPMCPLPSIVCSFTFGLTRGAFGSLPSVLVGSSYWVPQASLPPLVTVSC